MENQRNFFRVTMYEHPVTVKGFGDPIEAHMRDVSGNGISFYTKNQFQEGDTLHVSFSIKEQEFEFDAKVERIGEGSRGRYVYGCRFLGQKEKETSILSSILLRLDAEKRKK